MEQEDWVREDEDHFGADINLAVDEEPEEEMSLEQMMAENKRMLDAMKQEKEYKKDLYKRMITQVQESPSLDINSSLIDYEEEKDFAIKELKLENPTEYVKIDDYDHWVNHYEKGYHVGSEWQEEDKKEESSAVQDVDDEDDDVVSVISEPPVMDDFYFTQLEEKQKQVKEMISARQLFRMLKQRQLVTMEIKRDPEDVHDYWLINTITLMNLLQPSHDFIFHIQMAYDSTPSISKIFMGLKFDKGNPCFKDLNLASLAVRAKWKTTAPFILAVMKDFSDYASAHHKFFSKLQHGELNELVRRSEVAILQNKKHVEKTNSLIEELLKHIDHLDLVLEHATERLDSKMKRAMNQYERAKKQQATDSNIKIASLGVKKFTDKYHHLSTKRSREFIRFRNQKKNCSKMDTYLASCKDRVMAIIEMVRFIHKTWDEILPHIQFLNQLEPYFKHTNMKRVGFLLAERWKELFEELKLSIHSMVYGNPQHLDKKKVMQDTLPGAVNRSGIHTKASPKKKKEEKKSGLRSGTIIVENNQPKRVSTNENPSHTPIMENDPNVSTPLSPDANPDGDSPMELTLDLSPGASLSGSSLQLSPVNENLDLDIDLDNYDIDLDYDIENDFEGDYELERILKQTTTDLSLLT
mmetsp:Transcript_9586/g.14157  ORF Transcript_9586/g.14157 Transcript_9586/m.14157 type:complete len:638 (+) Transcript_9586:81-1994(+)|eukprot:CAMPEP_0117421544 /NCGR_PEP_ID=MMETSP0758-20121206/2599_1 /TAXON_ID=63605 /ORGANISM="Percolomonas cosmopolitus, Strain AE-1 (ATCC 50343)" /LENGTH=637 /DNA_ID=CAMNT_0005203701 /DNA_START=39 /DNA_END=1952 /DNA_ORIENTATION=+